MKKQIVFDAFRLDPAEQCLWKGTQEIKLRPKAFAVLTFLVGRPGHLVTKEELFTAVWPETFVGEAVLKVAIRQIREALGDDSKTPRFIETAHRRGYRFISPIGSSGPDVTDDPEKRSNHGQLRLTGVEADFPRGVVGRGAVLARMESRLERALAGERQIVFIAGEAGIGKTAVVDTFVNNIATDKNIRISRGQCLEQYGTGEPYLPVLEAIARLCRAHPAVVDMLRTHAPLWLLQMPSLLSAPDRELLNREMSGATRERMLREMSDALEELTSDQPMLLVLEDLHWSDCSTLDLISYLARQRQSAQLMVIGTYRPIELIVSGHPLKAVKQDLMAKQQCEELPLEYLGRDEVARYLSMRFPVNRFPAQLAALIHRRTEGSPLFMVNAVNYLVRQQAIAEFAGCWELFADIENVKVGVPDSVRQIIEKQIDHLDSDYQRTLEAASSAGAEFSSAALAAGLAEDRVHVEVRCDELARQRQFIQHCGAQVLPNGETVSRYGFIHSLYQDVLYDRVSAARRVQLHRRIAKRGEEVFGARAKEIATQLAMHFERGAEYSRAVEYLQQAAENGIRRFAYREAVALSRRGLELIERLPDTPERARQELCLHITLGVPLIATEGYAAADVGSTYTRARELCRQLGDTPEIPQALWGLWTFYLVRAELPTAREIAQEFLRVAERLPYASLAMGVTLMHMAEFASAMVHLDRALSLYDAHLHRDDAFRYAQNPAVAALCHSAWALWFLGQPDQALDRAEEARNLADELAEPHGMAHALFFASIVHQLRREAESAEKRAAAAIAIAGEHRLLLYQATSSVSRGWALIHLGRHEEAIEQLCQGLGDHQATGTELLRPHFLALLAEALNKAGKSEDALRVLDEALEAANNKGELYYIAELYRLKAEVLLAHPGTPAETTAEACLHESIRIAQHQKAKSLELRAVMTLARHYQSQGRDPEGRRLLAPIHDGFTEGYDVRDLREAQTMLDTLSAPVSA